MVNFKELSPEWEKIHGSESIPHNSSRIGSSNELLTTEIDKGHKLYQFLNHIYFQDCRHSKYQVELYSTFNKQGFLKQRAINNPLF